ncbi:flagellar export protein FliJ [Gemmatimonas sp.]|uniref:flagellar export protein FliJ n=1 Tax=Gemmatimonas sp. TaxID=1962908 RepID=UPI00286D3013|nr:flagellar export protein FliJ [Gemmatimonas sp.]
MSFKFRLQRILELREQHEQAKARALASARDTAEAAHRAKDEIANLRDHSKQQISTTANNGPRIGHLHQLGFVLASLDERVLLAADAAKLADSDVQKAQGMLEEAARDRRVLDRLKSRHADTWRADSAHKDRVAMDEIALAQFSRKAGLNAADDAANSNTPIDGSHS